MVGLLLVLQVGTLSAQNPADTVYDRVILGGHVMDPASQLDAVRNIGLVDGRIAVVTTDAIRGRDTVDARGLVVAPGFIDLHAHGQTAETYRFQSLDGVTTSLELELGTSDVEAWYRERTAGERINYGVSIGHIKVRMLVMHDSGTVMPVSDGAYRAASPAQIGEIAQRMEIGLSEGAVSIGAGFPYTPAATRDELLAVFRVAATTKTPIHVHIRPGVAGLRDALSLADETNASLHVVHINSASLAETPVMLEMIREARARGHDVTTEAYPYAAGMTEIQSATIQDMYRAVPDERLAELEWPATGERLNRDSFERYSRIGGPVVVHTNTEQMVAVAITSPLTIIASDAYWQRGTGHPRTTGTFSRVLGRYAREALRTPSPNGRGGQGVRSLSLMDAIRKMTLLPAQRLEARVPAMRQKGRLHVGADADITIFDPRAVVDRSTYREPSLLPVGIQHVIVNGVSVVANGRAVEGALPGKAVRAPIDSVPEPLVIQEQGSFAVGGSVVMAPGTFDPIAQGAYNPAGPDPRGQTLHGDHAYVFYQRPVNARRLPLVFWHGHGQSAKTWETTPDGREGFQTIFLRRGFSVYLIDQPRRARAGRSTKPITIPAAPDEQMWFGIFRLGVWPNLYPNVQFSRDSAALNQFFRQAVPNTGPYEAEVNVDAVSALFDKIGPGVLVTHSQSGTLGWRTAIKSRNVRAIVSYEPGGDFLFPEGEAPSMSFSGRTFTPPTIPLSDFLQLTKVPIVVYYGDNIPEQPSTNPGQEQWHVFRATARAWQDAVNRHGGDVTLVDLPAIGIRGNTHFPMSDLNNVEIANHLSAFLRTKGLE